MSITASSEFCAKPRNSSCLAASKANYGHADLVGGLRQIGLTSGDTVFFQVSHRNLGSMDCGPSEEEVFELLYSAMQEVIGIEGTMLLPAFSFSFLRNEEFDLDATSSVQGEWSSSLEFLEYFRKLPGVVRSSDPNYSVAGLGPQTTTLLTQLPNTSFGEDCLYERLAKSGAKICGIGVGLADTPFLHYVEESLEAPFRYKKLFTGIIERNGKRIKQGWVSSIPIQDAESLSNANRLEKVVRSDNQCCVADVAMGEIVAIDCSRFCELIIQEMTRDQRIVNHRRTGDAIILKNAGDRSKDVSVQLPENASMEELISALWKLPRDIVSDGYDAALYALSTQLPMTIHGYPTGSECWTWIVPEKWQCHEARLETLDGRCLFSYQDSPLHVVSYSLPISREVSKEELFEHLHVHPVLPDAIPFVFKYYERDWGLCCSRNLKDSLRDDRYRVMIRSEFSCGILKVGEVIVPGKSAKTFVLCAHLCHPAMVNDDLSGVVVGLKVMQELLKRPNLHYTYRFLILPETIGSIAYLSHQQELIPQMIGGLFLEMLGLQNPHALQLSFAGDTEIDRCLSQTLKALDPQGWTGPFRTIVGNDERQFNAPGVRVPMLSLSRVMQENPRSWRYYPEYHSSHDTPELASSTRLTESQDTVLKMIEAIEGNRVPVNRYQGEICCSRYGLNIDAYANPEGNRAFFDIIFLVDGTRSVAEIACVCKISLECAQSVVDDLYQHGLIEYTDPY
jgi:aminopeptidase-like protein/aminoglycoside N3'-acetyltransferase